MHTRYLHYESEWNPIPDVPDHSVSPDGRVRKDSINEILPRLPCEGEPRVWIVTDKWSAEGLVANFVMTVYKPMHIPIHLARGKVTYAWIDGDHNNCHAGNMIWLFKEPVEVPNREGYFYVPDFTRYAINTGGELVTLESGLPYGTTVKPEGYVMHDLRSDHSLVGEKVWIGRHRLLCTTFKGYGVDLYQLVTNHLNGIPGDDWLDNLELVTYSDNIIHAYANGLRTDNVHVAVMDHHTKEVKSFYSYGRAAEDIGCSPSNIYNTLRQPPGYLYKDRWQIVVRDPSSEPSFPPPLFGSMHGRANTVHLLNPATGETLAIDGVKKAAAFLNVSPLKFSYYLNSDCQVPYPIWRAKFTTWREWKDVSEFKQPMIPTRGCTWMYKITDSRDDSWGYYFDIRNLPLEGWKLKQLSGGQKVGENKWQYKHYLIETLPPLFSSVKQ